MRVNVHADGSWLFRRCAAENLLANRTEHPESAFHLDFLKLRSLISREVTNFTGQPVEEGDLYFYMSIFEIPDPFDQNWGDITRLRNGVYARQQFAAAAIEAGFGEDGVFTVPLKRWMIHAFSEGRYQEKLVDTSLVARLVERSIRVPEAIQVVVAGDIDMLPGIEMVVPNYSRSVILVATHAQQFDVTEQQTSIALQNFDFDHGPIYLDDHVAEILGGPNVYRCANPRCGRYFARERPIPRGANPMCATCFAQRFR